MRTRSHAVAQWLEGGVAYDPPLFWHKVNSQDTSHRLRVPEQPIGTLRGVHAGGGGGTGLAQSLCPWWIEGMLALVAAIEDEDFLENRGRRLAMVR